jgi:hypothetical protein
MSIRARRARPADVPPDATPANQEFPMPQYMLLLHDDLTAYADMTPGQMQALLERYQAWAGRLGAEGRLVGGEKLKDEGGRRMRKQGGKVVVVDGPYSETKEVIGGYFTIKAESYADAVEIARSCPHLDYRGVIDVREVDELEPPPG